MQSSFSNSSFLLTFRSVLVVRVRASSGGLRSLRSTQSLPAHSDQGHALFLVPTTRPRLHLRLLLLEDRIYPALGCIPLPALTFHYVEVKSKRLSTDSAMTPFSLMCLGERRGEGQL